MACRTATSPRSRWTIAYAARHPERVSHLVLLGAFARGVLVRQPGAAQRETLAAMARLVLAGWGQDNAAFRQMVTTQFFPNSSREHSDAFNDLQRLSCTPEHAQRLMLAFAALDASSWLAGVACPALVLHCRGDVRVPFEEGRFVAAGIRNARFEPVDSMNHIPLSGEPAFEEILALIHDFLPASPGAQAGTAFAGLTRREREVVELLSRPGQRADRRALGAGGKDGAQQHVRRLREVGRRKPRPGHRARPRRGVRPRGAAAPQFLTDKVAGHMSRSSAAVRG